MSNIPIITPEKLAEYRQGGEGFVKWANAFVYLPIFPENSDVAIWTPLGDLPKTKNPHTGRSYYDMWQMQQEHIVPALEMENGRFKNRLIIFCWMRGEGKSAVACLIQEWKFFCWPKQQIVLGANSKDQTKFVHYDIIRETIANSPALLAFVGGYQNLQEKQISLRDPRTGTVLSAIRSISSFNGIVSNITGYTFSEMFDMKNPKFFTQLDGSTRNVPNALGVIDSTVSDKSHVLYKMYEAVTDGSLKQVHFSYRCSPYAESRDYYHPQMTQAQLDSYKHKFPPAEFDRYFKNLWDAGSIRFFTDEQIDAIGYWGVDNNIGNHAELIARLEAIHGRMNAVQGYRNIIDENKLSETNSHVAYLMNSTERPLKTLQESLVPVSNTYMLQDRLGSLRFADATDLAALSDLFNTDWSIHAGLDRADPMAVNVATRTVLTVVAKGLPGSRAGMNVQNVEKEVPYIYVVVGMVTFKEHNLDDIKNAILEANYCLDGIDTFCSERWGAWDLSQWSFDNGIECELVSPTYERQRACFNEFYNCVVQGRFKCPAIPIHGSREEDVFREEIRLFTHDPLKKWFGSPEKHSPTGVQDDTMYATGWAMYGGRNFNYMQFRKRGIRMEGVGYFEDNIHLLGSY